MKLTQRRYPFTQFEFEITDDVVKVSTTRLLGSNGFEVRLRELSPSPSFYRSFPLSWLIFAVIFGAIAGFFFYALFSEPAKSERIGLVVAILVFLFACLACVHGFLQRKVDFIILHAEQSGQAIYLHRRIPSEQHVQEFVEIMKEHIEQSRL